MFVTNRHSEHDHLSTLHQMVVRLSTKHYKLLEKRVVEIYTVLEVGEVYFVYNSLTGLYFLL